MKIIIYLFCFFALLAAPTTLRAEEKTSLKTIEMAVKGSFKNITKIDNTQVGDLDNISIYTDEELSILLGSFDTKIIVLNLWATWCAPCISELPSFIALEEIMDKKSIKILPVSVDLGKNTAELKSFLKRNKLEKLSFYHDRDDMLFTALEYQGLPQTYILGPKREILYKVTGEADWNSPEVVTFLNALMGKVSEQSPVMIKDEKEMMNHE